MNKGETIIILPLSSETTSVVRLSVVRLSRTATKQLATYIRWADEQGCYYGNKKQFAARHAALMELADTLEAGS